MTKTDGIDPVSLGKTGTVVVLVQEQQISTHRCCSCFSPFFSLLITGIRYM